MIQQFRRAANAPSVEMCGGAITSGAMVVCLLTVVGAVTSPAANALTEKQPTKGSNAK